MDRRKNTGLRGSKNCWKIYYEEYNRQLAVSSTRVNWKVQKHTDAKPKEGFLSKSITEYYSDLKMLAARYPEFEKTRRVAARVYKDHCEQKDKKEDEYEPANKKKRFRAPGVGRTPKAADVQAEMFDWFLDIMGCLKGRLPRKMCVAKCKDVYGEWLQ